VRGRDQEAASAPLLPDDTVDDTARGWGEDGPYDDSDDEDARLIEDRPPHHDRD